MEISKTKMTDKNKSSLTTSKVTSNFADEN